MPHDKAAHSATGQTWNDVLPMSFWTTGASPGWGGGGATELGFVINMTAAMNKRDGEPPMGDVVRLIDSVGKDERWYEKVEDSFHVHMETLSSPRKTDSFGPSQTCLRQSCTKCWGSDYAVTKSPLI